MFKPLFKDGIICDKEFFTKGLGGRKCRTFSYSCFCVRKAFLMCCVSSLTKKMINGNMKTSGNTFECLAM